MASSEFKGDISNFSEVQLNYIKNVLIKRGLKDDIISVEPVGKAGDNYQSVIKRLVTKINDTPFQVIAKIAPTNDFMRNLANTGAAFKNEIIIYDEVFPKFKQILQSAKIAKNKVFRTPECYGHLSDPPNELILLEDLEMSHFCLLDKFKPLTDESMKLVLKDLAVLHSLSYVLKEQFPEMFLDIKNKLVNLWSLMGSDAMKGFSNKLEEDIIKALDNDQFKAAARGTVTEIANESTKLLKNDEESKHAVILQGDCWINNILFRLEGEKPVEAVMIDYQGSKIGRPVVDFLYLTLICTDHETRIQHYRQWMDYYHLELGESLKRFGIQIDNYYSRDVFDADLKTHGKFGLSLSLALTFPMLGEVPDMQNLDLPNLMQSLGSDVQNFDMQKMMELLGSNMQNLGGQNLDLQNVMESLGPSLQNLDLQNLDIQKVMELFGSNKQDSDIQNMQNIAINAQVEGPESLNVAVASKAPAASRLKNKIEDCIKSALEFGLI